MGAISGMLGLAGGVGGTGFAGPSAANIQSFVTPEQIKQAYQGTQGGLEQQQALLQALQQQQGIANQAQVYNQLQNIVGGGGPNPALAQLAQTTGQNIAAQQALMAGQRGAAQNVGMLARQAGMQGGALQQQAAGQAATLAAQQQMSALGQAGQMATTQAGQQIAQTQAAQQAQAQQQAQLMGQQQAYNQQQIQQQAAINAANAQLAGQTMGMAGSAIGGVMQGLGGGLAGGLMKSAAPVPAGVTPKPMAEGGDVANEMTTTPATFGQFLKENYKPQAFAKGGCVHDYRAGGHVKAKSAHEKAVKSGDNYANDKIPAVLSEHEIVIPRSVTMGPNPIKGSADFVAKVMAKRKVGK